MMLEVALMCRYLTKNELKEAKGVFIEWVTKVQSKIKKENNIYFSVESIGSGRRNMVIQQCNRDSFDLDYQITLTRLPQALKKQLSKNAKEINYLFKNTFDELRPNGFDYCDDSTQALTTLNSEKHYGYDITITYVDNCGVRYILYNKKDTNNANNKDYYWAKKADMSNDGKNYLKVVRSKHYGYLRDLYKNERHKHKYDVEPNKMKSYQILNEAVVNTLKHFNEYKEK